MRLIDADKLKIRNVSADYWYTVMGVTENDIDYAPTVKAIPIEWLMKKADEWTTKDITYDGKPFTTQQVGLAIALMVIDWEKENE